MTGLRIKGPALSIPKGFSLVEIVLALGIMSFALVGILGLFPAALETARDSKAETRIAIIAQSLLTEIRTSQDDDNQQIAVMTSPIDRNFISLTTDSDLALGFTEGGQVDGIVSDFAGGSALHPFIVRLVIDFQDPSDSSSEFPGLTKIEMQIDYPGAASEEYRKSFSFVTLLAP